MAIILLLYIKVYIYSIYFIYYCNNFNIISMYKFLNIIIILIYFCFTNILAIFIFLKLIQSLY